MIHKSKFLVIESSVCFVDLDKNFRMSLQWQNQRRYSPENSRPQFGSDVSNACKPQNKPRSSESRYGAGSCAELEEKREQERCLNPNVIRRQAISPPSPANLRRSERLHSGADLVQFLRIRPKYFTGSRNSQTRRRPRNTCIP